MNTEAARPPGRLRLIVICAAAFLALAVAVAWLTAGPEAPGAVNALPGGPAATVPPASSDAMARLGIPAESAMALPQSLDGTSAPGNFTIDAAGRFVPDLQARRLFDYFFSASGEEDDRVIRGRILLHALGGGLSEVAVAEIAGVLDKYIAYRAAAKSQATTDPAGKDDPRVSAERIRNLQLTMLGPDLQKAFFGEDMAAFDLDMQRLAILRDTSIGEDERKRRLAALDAGLPADVRDARAAATAPAALHQRVETLRASGGSETEIANARREAYGPDATARLEALDRERARWSDRYAAYARERDALHASYGLVDSAAYRTSLETLRQRHFTAQELTRVRALDGAGAQ